MNPRTPLYLIALMWPGFGVAIAWVHLLNIQVASGTVSTIQFVETFGLVIISFILGYWTYQVFVAPIKAWQRWAQDNHGQYQRPKGTSVPGGLGGGIVVDQIEGQIPGTSKSFTMRRLVNAPLLGPGRRSMWASVDLTIKGNGSDETHRQQYIWFRSPSVESMLEREKSVSTAES